MPELRNARRFAVAGMILMGLTPCLGVVTAWADPPKKETLAEIGARMQAELQPAYEACPFAPLSKNYFSRFSVDPAATPSSDDVVVNEHWTISTAHDARPLTRLMATHLADFFKQAMKLDLRVIEVADMDDANNSIVLLDSHGGLPGKPESFTIDARTHQVLVRGADAAGLRDGVVKFVDLIGFRQAPFLRKGRLAFTPRIPVRLGAIPYLGSTRDLVFLGYNAMFAGGGSLYSLSTSDAIPELAGRRAPHAPGARKDANAEAHRYGLKTYCFVDIRQKFPKDDPVFQAHPDIRGALTWKADGEYVMCTEHPLVKRWLSESVEGIFKEDPELNGLVLIIGGEGFYHCFMRPYGVKKGHTNCPRCEAIGADTVVSNLCNTLAEAARKANPNAEVIAWPYSAEHVWSSDKAQTGMIKLLKPGTAIFTEMEKDEFVEKPEGVRKSLWDYSIDLIGPGERAKQQIAACKAAGISIYVKSEPETTYEAPRLPEIPCLDRWVDRAEALVSCGASGAWVFPAFRSSYGSAATEAYKYAWWAPAGDKEAYLQQLAARVAGPAAGPRLRDAWKQVSEAITWSPEIPTYYTGPYYLGPAQPMCADLDAKLPEVFDGYYLFMAEITDAEGVKLRPTYFTSPTGNVPVFLKYYRKMEELLGKAVDDINAASAQTPERCQLQFRSEASSIRWFYHTARTEANFYESCQLRDKFRALAAKPARTPEELEAAKADYARWLEVLRNEKTNTADALPVMQGDMRLDFYFGGDHSFHHGVDVLRAKLAIMDTEINETLPALAKRCGIDGK